MVPPPETPATEHQDEPVTEQSQQPPPEQQAQTGSAAATATAAEAPKPAPPAEEQSGHPQPSIGRIVHYIGTDRHVRPAIITQAAPGGAVNLHVFRDAMFDPSAHDFNPVLMHIPYDGDLMPAAGTWHWPPRV